LADRLPGAELSQTEDSNFAVGQPNADLVPFSTLRLMDGHPGHYVARANTSRQRAESIDLALLRLGGTGSWFTCVE